MSSEESKEKNFNLATSLAVIQDQMKEDRTVLRNQLKELERKIERLETRFYPIETDYKEEKEKEKEEELINRGKDIAYKELGISEEQQKTKPLFKKDPEEQSRIEKLIDIVFKILDRIVMYAGQKGGIVIVVALVAIFAAPPTVQAFVDFVSIFKTDPVIQIDPNPLIIEDKE